MRTMKQQRVKGLILAVALVLTSLQVHAADQGMIAWGELGDATAGSYDLYFSTQDGGEWSNPEVISASPLPDILPALGSNSRGDVWLVWTQLEDVTGSLKFRRRVNGEWLAVETFVTDLKTDMAPALIVDSKGILWLAWSGVADQDDDIYYSRWLGTKWAEPALAHPDNSVPDVLPELTLSSQGNPQLSWQSYDGEKYVTMVREWDGKQWGLLRDHDMLMQRSVRQHQLYDSAMKDLPVFISDFSQASLLLKGTPGSIRLKEQM